MKVTQLFPFPVGGGRVRPLRHEERKAASGGAQPGPFRGRPLARLRQARRRVGRPRRLEDGAHVERLSGGQADRRPLGLVDRLQQGLLCPLQVESSSSLYPMYV